MHHDSGEIRKWCSDKMQPGVTGRCRGKQLSCFSSTCQKNWRHSSHQVVGQRQLSQKSEAFQLINSADKCSVSAGKFGKDNLIMQGLCSAVYKCLPVIPIWGTGTPDHGMLIWSLLEQHYWPESWLGWLWVHQADFSPFSISLYLFLQFYFSPQGEGEVADSPSVAVSKARLDVAWSNLEQ